MGRKPRELGGDGRRLQSVLFLLPALAAFTLVYTAVSLSRSRRPAVPATLDLESRDGRFRFDGEESVRELGDCCRGVENRELWGSVVKWGTNFRFNTSRECCQACKDMCLRGDGQCLCDSWVFCGNRERCKDKFGECWLKKQKDAFFPQIQASGDYVVWTSGIIFGKGEGIIGLDTDYGTLHIKLYPDCAPRSVEYIAQVSGSRNCVGCQFYRAEGRGRYWDSEGNHVARESGFGPPYGMIQGTLESEGFPFNDIPKESCPSVRRGSVAWIDSGPDFFVSLANHDEWQRAYTVFASVLPEDMMLAEQIAQLPTRPDIWNGIKVGVLERPVHLKVKRVTTIQ